MRSSHFVNFVRESNRIEGITREPTEGEVAATAIFTKIEQLNVGDVQALVHVYQFGARLRRHPGMDVRVGNHVPPRGGAHVEKALIDLLDSVNAAKLPPWHAHLAYETLHPFTDGNGRSGRAVWLWQMLKLGGRAENWALDLGFLHSFYYQTLQEVGR
jgi:hypothetical protein